MRLNPDCMRAVLLVLEDSDYGKTVYQKDLYSQLENEYSHEDIDYSISKLKEAGFINARIKSYDNGQSPIIYIDDITYEGHQFLSSIRSNTIWEKVKEKLTDKGIDSVLAFSKIALDTILTNLNL